ncbi:hypothetical protein JRQ81_000230 [Phrynocephalus forsythii]|uniref:Uncharacterized protein n=1 Tax=Phrynocephalus forsythii TaxID=171643 RepID=A0A9Q1B7Q8_9SAUR|nr:hypothetical protein JRQ81_000230 [Phrynocephalus forsythii]
MACGASGLSFADGERLGEVTDPGRRAAGAHASSPQRKAEDSSESREDEQMVVVYPVANFAFANMSCIPYERGTASLIELKLVEEKKVDGNAAILG